MVVNGYEGRIHRPYPLREDEDVGAEAAVVEMEVGGRRARGGWRRSVARMVQGGQKSECGLEM